MLVAFLLMYRIDAQNVALNENDLEDTEWLTLYFIVWICNCSNMIVNIV